MTKAQNLNEFKEVVGETVKQLESSLWTDKFKNDLFRSLIKTPEYQELRKTFLDEKISEWEKEASFQEAYISMKKINSELDEEEFRKIIMWKSENFEQKEEIEWLPKLAENNFRVEDTSNWKEITDPNGIKVKENPEWDVWEYLKWAKKWEQLFTKASAIRETKAAGKKLPASSKVFEDIIKQKYKWDYQAFLLWEGYKDKDGNKTSKFCGWRDPYYKRFYDIAEVFNVWCEDGSNFDGDNFGWSHSSDNDNYGFSVRCVQG
jgi:hypothetical protein